MIVEPDILNHPKFINLKKRLKDRAMEVLVRLWAHCQQNKRGGFWKGADRLYVEIVITGRSMDGKLFAALAECGWVNERDGGIEVHDWNFHNASLVANWTRNTKGRPTATATGQPAGYPAGYPTANPDGGVRKAPDRTGQDRTGQEVLGEKKKGTAQGGEVARLRTQFAALRDQIRRLEARGDDLEPDEREDLRKKRALLEAVQKKQAEGKA